MDDNTKLMSPRPLGAGSQIDWYNIREVLGMGGLGITYRAHDGKLGREVAIREYLPTAYAVRHVKYSVQPISGDHEKRFAQGLYNFLKVAKTLEQFSHDNIIKVHNVIETNNTGYMVMECENGVSLESIIEQCGTLEQNHQTQIFFSIFKGLQQIHDLGFVHGSIKPSNIRIRENGSPVLLDFGTARQTSLHQPMESTALVNQDYMPLEQYSEGYGEQGPWTDIYSLAAIMYQGVTGTKPDEALSRSDYQLRAQPDTVQELLAEAHPTYKQVFLGALHAGLTLQPQHRPQSLNHWHLLFEGDLRAYRQHSTGVANDLTDNQSKTPPDEVNISADDQSKSTPEEINVSADDQSKSTADEVNISADNQSKSTPDEVNIPASAPISSNYTEAQHETTEQPAVETMAPTVNESHDELDIALGSAAPDETDDEFQSAGVLASQPDNQNSGIKSILLGCLIVAVLAVLVGILFVQTNDTQFTASKDVGDSDQSELNEQNTASMAIDPIKAPGEQSTDTSKTASIVDDSATAPNSETVSTDTSNADDSVDNLTEASLSAVYFDKPVPNDPQSDSPRTIAQILESASPFSPVDDMDDKFWKDKDCSECHIWTRESLCKQGKFYDISDDNTLARIQHPFDGYFKLALKNWASNDCG